MNRRNFIKLLLGTTAGVALGPTLSSIEKWLPEGDYKKDSTLSFWMNDKGEIKEPKTTYFTGNIAMVRLYDRYLSSEEIQKIYDHDRETRLFDQDWEHIVLNRDGRWMQEPSGLWALSFDGKSGFSPVIQKCINGDPECIF